ncbi:probable cytochrome P450 6a23 [Planococcus citri]|uniref:probable cytochrome P450 6a23 n=1 Tax=Planococcus citri TaxID=170843 RepID=UPI0031F95FC1
MLAEVLLFITSALFLIYLSIKKKHKYWLKKNVPYIKPKNLILGNTTELFFKGLPLVKYHETIYNELAPHPYGGYFHFVKPVFIARDPNLIKTILIKDFQHFMNRGSGFMDENEPLTQNLFNLGGEQWKNLRIKITPAFSSGKIKIMFNLMKECTEELISLIDQTISTEHQHDIEVKELMSRFTTDIISSCVFGLQSNTLKNPDSVFRQMGKRIFATPRSNQITQFLNSIFPWLRRLLKFKIIDPQVNDFFVNLVKNTIEYRELNNESRNDFLDLLIALRKETSALSHDDDQLKDANRNDKKFEFNDGLLTAQCFVFFVAGYETSSGTLTFALYELAKNQEIQNKLRQEIDKVLTEFDGQYTYECIQNMVYLDQIVNETLRLYPILPFLVRVCTKTYTLPDTDTVIEKGTRVIIPILGLHHDPEYYPDPLKFNPENFSKDIKTNRLNCTYIPFGEGPRICIGMRFGLLQIKLGLAMMIRNFIFDLSPDLKLPFGFRKYSILTTVEGDMLLTFKKRTFE